MTQRPAVAATPLPAPVREAIDALRQRYPTSGALLLPALHVAQQHAGGWLPEALLGAIADYLGLSAANVAGVVSFYDMFHESPVGRHRVRVCTNLSCQLRGGEEILAAVKAELGVGESQVTADDRCSVVHFECLGSCDTAPMMMVDDEYHENLTPERARQIVRELD